MAPRWAVAWLVVAGAGLVVGGAAAILAGTLLSAWLYGLLPPLVIDQAAVGGAATASGVALVSLGAVHLAAAAALRRRLAAAITPAVALAATMTALCIGWGVAALVSWASGSGPAAALVPAGIGLGLAAIGYGWTARGLIGLRRPPHPLG